LLTRLLFVATLQTASRAIHQKRAVRPGAAGSARKSASPFSFILLVATGPKRLDLYSQDESRADSRSHTFKWNMSASMQPRLLTAYQTTPK